jgi:predicted DNA-binding transcriptional regulator YafY
MDVRLFNLVHLLRKGGVMRLSDLCEELDARPKTLKLDIQHLKSMRHEISYSRKDGWHYLSPPPELSLSPDALFALLVAQKTLATYRGTPFEQPLRETFERFSGENAKAFSCSWELLSHVVSIKQTGVSTADLGIYRTLVNGITKSRELRIRYRGNKDARPRSRRIRPFHLCCANNSWYLFAYDYEADDTRTFALPRISDAAVLETTFVPPDARVIEDQLSGGFGIMFNSPQESVTIKFSPEIATWVAERVWSPEQTIERSSDGSVILSMPAGLTPEFEQWLLSFGELAQVLKPRKLADVVKRRMRSAIRAYTPPPRVAKKRQSM